MMHPRILRNQLSPVEINMWHAYFTRQQDERERERLEQERQKRR